jgi:hypothetical protein
LFYCKTEEINQLVKQSIFLLTKLRMRYFIIDDYWRILKTWEER